jgi:hypothetical protein
VNVSQRNDASKTSMTPNALLPGVILLSPGEGRQYSCGPMLGGVHLAHPERRQGFGARRIR